jgi:hypothetical protein
MTGPLPKLGIEMNTTNRSRQIVQLTEAIGDQTFDEVASGLTSPQVSGNLPVGLNFKDVESLTKN